jgi:hypothetical protein
MSGIYENIIWLIKRRFPSLVPVFNAVDILELSLNRKDHNSKVYAKEIKLTANDETVNVERLTIAGDANGKPFTIEVSIMDTLTDPQNTDGNGALLPAYITLTVTFNKYLLIHAIPSRMAQIIFNKLKH